MRARCWCQETPYGRIAVSTTERGVRTIDLPGDDAAHVYRPHPYRVHPYGDDSPLDEVRGRDHDVARALQLWFDGTSRAFDLPIDLDEIAGFRRTVLETLAREVGWGETVSYGELAAIAGRPRAARAVGTAMASNPIPFVIPCHRVIAAGGRIGGYGGSRNAIALKRSLLAREGVSLPDLASRNRA